jgi:hypothetical protein
VSPRGTFVNAWITDVYRGMWFSDEAKAGGISVIRLIDRLAAERIEGGYGY